MISSRIVTKTNEIQLHQIRRKQLQIHLNIGYINLPINEINRQLKLLEQRYHPQSPDASTAFKEGDCVQIINNLRNEFIMLRRVTKVLENNSRVSLKCYLEDISYR